MVTHEALRVLKNELSFVKKINRQYSDQFAKTGAKIGDLLTVRMPPRYLVGSGQVMAPQDFVEPSVQVRLDQQKHIGLSFPSVELLLDIDNFSRRVIQPAIAQLANQVDYDGLQLYKEVANNVGTPANVPNNLDTYLNAKAVLSNCAAPMDANRAMVINPTMAATIVFALRGLFQSSTQIKEQYEKGEMGLAAGWNWSEDQNCPSHVKGNIVGGAAPAVNGAGQTGTSIVTNAWAAGATLLKGDIITFAGVNQVNPQNRQSTGVAQPFVVTADATADGAGNMTIPIYPALTPSGAFQTVTASPAGGALISVYGAAAAGFGALANATHREGIGFHRDAFTMVSADLPLPSGAKAARATDPDFGLSVRIVEDYNILTDQNLWRLDILYGFKTVRPELAVRILS